MSERYRVGGTDDSSNERRILFHVHSVTILVWSGSRPQEGEGSYELGGRLTRVAAQVSISRWTEGRAKINCDRRYSVEETI